MLVDVGAAIANVWAPIKLPIIRILKRTLSRDQLCLNTQLLQDDPRHLEFKHMVF